MMLAQPKTTKINKNSPFYFGEEMLDGRFTADYDNSTFHLRDAIAESKSLGRILTTEEMNAFKTY